jgi:hypothetical protein
VRNVGRSVARGIERRRQVGSAYSRGDGQRQQREDDALRDKSGPSFDYLISPAGSS